MAFNFDSLKANVTNMGRSLSQKTKNIADSSALQKEMSNEKRNIQQKYAEIGQLYYEKYMDDTSSEFYAEMESITNSTKRIEELQAQIQDIQARKPELVPVPSDEQKLPGAQPSAMVCPQCGSTYDTTQTFCASCGQKLIPQYPTPAAAATAPVQTAEDVQSVPADIIPSQVAPESAPEASGAFCPNCGAPTVGDSAFCAQCGTQLK